MTAPLAVPPYALPAFGFPCPGLAAFAARADADGHREVAMACCVFARLAAGAGPPVALSVEIRRERADAARAWLATLALQQDRRVLLARALKTTAAGTATDVAAELDHVADELADVLDEAASADLTRLAKRLRS